MLKQIIIILIVFWQGSLYGNFGGDRLEANSKKNSNKALFVRDFRVTCKNCPRFVRRPEHEIREIIGMACKETNRPCKLINIRSFKGEVHGCEITFKDGMICIEFDIKNNECSFEFMHYSDDCSWTPLMGKLISFVRLSERRDVTVDITLLGI